jgi:hypothetical protein
MADGAIVKAATDAAAAAPAISLTNLRMSALQRVPSHQEHGDQVNVLYKT